jgi:NADH:ubiquinone oxidoreductase subunit 4 (subunit M)
MGGFATVMPGVAAFFTLACLSSLGMPGTAGFVAEFLVFAGAWKSGTPGGRWAFRPFVTLWRGWVTAVYVWICAAMSLEMLQPIAVELFCLCRRAFPAPHRHVCSRQEASKYLASLTALSGDRALYLSTRFDGQRFDWDGLRWQRVHAAL